MTPVAYIQESETATAEQVLGVLAELCHQAQEPADLPDVMGGLADATRQLMGVDRVTVLFLQDDRLKPVVSVARRADSRLWATFLAMPPVVIAPTAADWELLRDGPLVVDAHTSPLIPPSWRDTFNLRWLALAPVFARGRPCGVLVADQSNADEATFDERALKIMRAVAALAGGLYNWSTENDQARATAIERAHRVLLDFPARGPVDELVERLAPSLRVSFGLEPVELVLLPPYRRSLGGRAPNREDVRLLKDWQRAGPPPVPADSGRRRLIPLQVGSTLVGGLAVRVVTKRTSTDTALFARWLAMALHVRHLTQQVTSVDASAHDDAQRLERVAARIGHVLHMMREPATASIAGATHVAPSPSRSVALRVIEELKDLEEMCKMRATSGGGLLHALRELAAAADPMQVTIKTQGRIALVPAPLAGCLPVAVRELIELAAGARARFVVITIGATETESEINFRADGHLAAADQATTRSTYETIRGLQRMLQPVNAELRLHNGGSHFLVVIKHPSAPRPESGLPKPRTLKPRDSA